MALPHFRHHSHEGRVSELDIETRIMGHRRKIRLHHGAPPRSCLSSEKDPSPRRCRNLGGSQYTYTAAEDDPLIEAARKTGIITEGNFFNLGRGDGGLEFLLILFLTPNLTELEIYQPSRYRSLKQIRHAVLNPSPPTSMGSRS
jgi:hypothetical protein